MISNNPYAVVLNDHWIPLIIEDHWSSVKIYRSEVWFGILCHRRTQPHNLNPVHILSSAESKNIFWRKFNYVGKGRRNFYFAVTHESLLYRFNFNKKHWIWKMSHESQDLAAPEIEDTHDEVSLKSVLILSSQYLTRLTLPENMKFLSLTVTFSWRPKIFLERLYNICLHVLCFF